MLLLLFHLSVRILSALTYESNLVADLKSEGSERFVVLSYRGLCKTIYIYECLRSLFLKVEVTILFLNDFLNDTGKAIVRRLEIFACYFLSEELRDGNVGRLAACLKICS